MRVSGGQVGMMGKKNNNTHCRFNQTPLLFIFYENRESNLALIEKETLSPISGAEFFKSQNGLKFLSF